MKTAAELRAEVQRMRALARTVSAPDVLTEIRFMIEELESRAQTLGIGAPL